MHLLTLLEAVSAEGGGAAPQGGAGEAPAAAAARALQSALGSSYLQKLLDMAGHDSSSGGSGAAGGRRAEGQLAVFAPGLCTAADLQHFLGAAAAADLAAAAAATGQAQQAALERLLAVAVPAAVWQRCAAGGLRVSWVAADAAGEPQLAALPALQAAVQQHCSHAAAARLADLAGECGADEFAARMALPRPAAAAEVQQGAGEAAVECWPQAAESQKEALDHLQLLLASLEGHKGEPLPPSKQIAPVRRFCALPGG